MSTKKTTDKTFLDQLKDMARDMSRKRVKCQHSKSLDPENIHTVLMIATDAIENITKNKYS